MVILDSLVNMLSSFRGKTHFIIFVYVLRLLNLLGSKAVLSLNFIKCLTLAKSLHFLLIHHERSLFLLFRYSEQVLLCRHFLISQYFSRISNEMIYFLAIVAPHFIFIRCFTHYSRPFYIRTSLKTSPISTTRFKPSVIVTVSKRLFLSTT